MKTNNWLYEFGRFSPTVKGDELKGYLVDLDEGGVCKCYLNSKDCREIASQFLSAAENLENNTTTLQDEFARFSLIVENPLPI